MDTRRHLAAHLEPLDRKSRVDDIAERLSSLIIDQGLRPGDQLNTERELIARLEVGRSSLREAIRTLCALGVLEIRRGKGTFVSNGDISMLTRSLSWGLFLAEGSVQQVIEARSMIEVALAGWAAERATEAEVIAIGGLLDTLEQAQGDMVRYVEADIAFHLGVAAAAHNDMMTSVLGMFQNVLRAWMETTYEEAGGAAPSMVVHRQIYAAIKAGDAAAARSAMLHHTSGGPLLAATKRAKSPSGDMASLFGLNRPPRKT